jgi:arsenate reductase
MENRLRVLFLCIHNSARSQMAEAFLKNSFGDIFQVDSAGIEGGKLNPLAVAVMREEGIDISGNETKEVSVFENTAFDYVITVCDAKSAESCPVFPGRAKKLAWDFDDPSAFVGSDDERLQQTRRVRDQIKKAVFDFANSIK